jgi:hypothetical protein
LRKENERAQHEEKPDGESDEVFHEANLPHVRPK